MDTERSRIAVGLPRIDPRAGLASRNALKCGTTVSTGYKISAPTHSPPRRRRIVWTGGSAVNMKKVLIITGVALVAFFLISQPEQSAALVNDILNTLKNAAEALITFVRSVFKG